MKTTKMLKPALLIVVAALMLCLLISGCSKSGSKHSDSDIQKDLTDDTDSDDIGIGDIGIGNILGGQDNKPEKDGAPSERQVQEDLIDNIDMAGVGESYIENVTDFEITKRQTDAENKTDNVWVRIDAENGEVAGQMYFVVSYGLYNDGWLLDSVTADQPDNWSIKPLKGLDDSVIQAYIPSGATIISNDLDIEYGIQTIEYSYTESYPLCDVVHQEELTFGFEGNGYYSSWAWDYIGVTDAGSYEDWYIDGTWEYSYDGITDTIIMRIEISGFDPQGIAYDNDLSNDSFEVSGYYQCKIPSMNYYCEDYGPFTVTLDTWAMEEEAPRYTIETSLGSKHTIRVSRYALYWDRNGRYDDRELTKID